MARRSALGTHTFGKSECEPGKVERIGFEWWQSSELRAGWEEPQVRASLSGEMDPASPGPRVSFSCRSDFKCNAAALL